MMQLTLCSLNCLLHSAGLRDCRWVMAITCYANVWVGACYEEVKGREFNDDDTCVSLLDSNNDIGQYCIVIN